MNRPRPNPRHEEIEDESSLPPPLLNPPPPPPLGPEPSFQTQQLLSDMFSQQSTLRNYDPGSIQAVMMALDKQRHDVYGGQQAEEEWYNEDASLALAHMMSNNNCARARAQGNPYNNNNDYDDYDDGDSTEHDMYRAHLSLTPPPCPTLPVTPAVAARPVGKTIGMGVPATPATMGIGLPTTMMRRDNSFSSSSADASSRGGGDYDVMKMMQTHMNYASNPLCDTRSVYTSSSDERSRTQSFGAAFLHSHVGANNSNNNSSNNISNNNMPTMEELQGQAIGEIMPLPPPSAKRHDVFDSSSGGSSQDDEDKKFAELMKSQQARFLQMQKMVEQAPVSSTPHQLFHETPVKSSSSSDTMGTVVDCHKKLAAVPSPPPTRTTSKGKSVNGSSKNSKDSNASSKKKRTKRKNRECLICQRTTAECKMKMRKLTCKHHFCASCIDRWLETKDTCPYCRQHVNKTAFATGTQERQQSPVPA